MPKLAQEIPMFKAAQTKATKDSRENCTVAQITGQDTQASLQIESIFKG